MAAIESAETSIEARIDATRWARTAGTRHLQRSVAR
jgi:hypothetical protein